jgi:protocatechuate 3,4-dioxygenase alpha subunit
MPAATSSQTIGPYWHLIEHQEWADLTRFGAHEALGGEIIRLTGRLVDGDDYVVTDAAVEIWQADPPASEAFPGFGRCRTDQEGRFTFTTLKPGPVPAGGESNAVQAPHLALSILARGLLKHLVTRVYFEGEALNAQDPVLLAVPEPRRGTLIARSAHPGTWRLDIRLQGGDETVFLEV